MALSNEQKVKRFVAKNPLPQRSLCPDFIVKWVNTSGIVFYDTASCKRSYGLCPNIKNKRPGYRNNITNVRNEYRGAYVRFISSSDMLELAIVVHPGGRLQDGKYDWKYWKRYFIFRGSAEVYDEYGLPAMTWRNSKTTRFMNGYLYNFISTDMSNCMWCSQSTEQIIKFIGGIDNVTGYRGKKVEVQYPWHWAELIKKYNVPRNTGKADPILELHVPEVTVDPYKYVTRPDRIIVFQVLSENYAVFRNFRCNHDFQCHEDNRTYVDLKGNVRTYFVDDNNLAHTTSKPYIYGNVEHVYLNSLEEFLPLKYISSCIDKREYVIPQIIDMLRHPIVEQLIKSGYQNIARMVMHGRNAGIKSNLRDEFGVKESKGKLTDVFGMNKYCLKRLNEACKPEFHENQYRHWYTHSYNTQTMKVVRLLADCDLMQISEQHANEVFDDANLLVEVSADFWNLLPDYVERYGSYRWRNNYNQYTPTEKDKRLLRRLCRLERQTNGTIAIFGDAVRTYHNLLDHNKPNIDLYDLQEYSDIVRFHDAVVDLQNQEQAERNRYYAMQEAEREKRDNEQMKKLQEKRIELFGYAETDSDFVIQLPESMADIKREGLILSHCVGGYASSHARGETNIIFLRRKGQEDIPFYTIEIRNNHLIQIHGRNNRWLGNVPDAVPFVYRYLMQLKDVSFDKNILLNKGIGYFRGAEYLPDSALTA